jgi:hypothetical protein
MTGSRIMVPEALVEILPPGITETELFRGAQFHRWWEYFSEWRKLLQDLVWAALLLGWSVVPCNIRKKPLLKSWREFQQEAATISTVLGWAESLHPAAWAVVTGKVSGLVVLDFDGPPGLETMRRLGLIDRTHVLTGSGSAHLYTKYPTELGVRIPTLNCKSARKLGSLYPGLDVKGDGGYAIFCGRNKSGPYVWKRQLWPDLITPDLYNLFLDIITLHKPEHTSRNLGDCIPSEAGTRVSVARLLSAALKHSLSGRNSAGFWLGCQLRDNGYTEGESEAVMSEYMRSVGPCNQKGEPEAYTEPEAFASLRQAFLREPRSPWALNSEQCGGNEESSADEPAVAKEAGLQTDPEAESDQAPPPAPPPPGLYLVSPTEQEKPKRRWICVDERRRSLSDMVADALAGLHLINTAYLFFLHGGRRVEVYVDEGGRCLAHSMKADRMCAALDKAANYYVYDRKENRVRVFPPFILVNQVLSCPPLELGFWPLAGIAKSPLVRKDGTILMKPGYDPETGYFVALNPHLIGLEVPMSPVEGDLQWALAILHELFDDFCFESPREAGFANALAALLTPLIRVVLDTSAIPILLISALLAGCGKSLLAKIIALVAGGSVDAIVTAPSPKEAGEWRKRILALLLESHSIVIIDNVTSGLESPDLCAALTNSTFGDRILGQNVMAHPRSDVQWIVTGNQLVPQAELARRAFWVRLDPKRPDPANRTDFRHDDLEETWVPQNRECLLRALLILTRWWVVAGMPLGPMLPGAANFMRWARVIGGILKCAGISGFLENAAFDASVDPEIAEWHGFLVVIAEVTYEEPFTSGKIDAIAKEVTWDTDTGRNVPSKNAAKLLDAIPGGLLNSVNKPGFRHVLGTAFRDRKGRYYGAQGIHLSDTGKRKHGVVIWQIRKKGDGEEECSAGQAAAQDHEGNAEALGGMEEV